MLPFLKPRKIASVTMIKATPEGEQKVMGEEGEPDHAQMSVAEDLIRAVHAKDVEATVKALESAFQIFDDDDEDEMPPPDMGQLK